MRVLFFFFVDIYFGLTIHNPISMIFFSDSVELKLIILDLSISEFASSLRSLLKGSKRVFYLTFNPATSLSLNVFSNNV